MSGTLTLIFDTLIKEICYCKGLKVHWKVLTTFFQKKFGGTHGYLDFFQGLFGQKLSFQEIFNYPMKIELKSNDILIVYMETKQTKGLNRNTIDKYYTKDNVVDLCLELVKKNIEINPDDLIIEPSAGNGSFIKGIKSLTNNFRFYDLMPDHNEIIKQDYLLYECKGATGKIHVIGNPPFGRQSSLAIKFIKKSCEFCDTVSFILPKSFKKDSLKKTFPLNFHLIYEIDLPDNSFLVDDEECNVETVFQIWIKKDINRTLVKKEEPYNFVFVKKTENPDISFRRVGVNAGNIDVNIDNKSIRSNYFIKFTNGKSIQENMIKLSTITYDFNNTVGPKSISKQELINKFNPFLRELRSSLRLHPFF